MGSLLASSTCTVKLGLHPNGNPLKTVIDTCSELGPALFFTIRVEFRVRGHDVTVRVALELTSRVASVRMRVPLNVTSEFELSSITEPPLTLVVPKRAKNK